MKNHNPSNQAITKRDLKDLCQDINKDFGKLVNDLMIQVDIKFEQINLRFDQQDKKIDTKFKEQEKMFDKKIEKNLSNSYLQIAEELRLSREERAALNYRQSIHSDQLENHDTRIAFIEKN